jgi:Glycosyltransferase family 87
MRESERVPIPLRWPHKLALASSAAYFLAFGVLSLAWHADGDDLLIFHAAGAATLQGLNPYTPGRFSDPFSYPPAWVPFCALLSLMPATVAIWVWKFLNVLFLIGAVCLSLKLVFGERAPSAAQFTIVWCFTLLLWPTSIAVFDGNTPLCVLFFALLSLHLSARDHPYAAGVCLGFSLIKPNVVAPLFALLFAQKRWHLLSAAFVVTGALTVLGIHLTGITPSEYFSALKVYNAANSVTDASSVGLAKLIAALGGIESSKARLIAVGVGALVVIILFARRFFGAQPRRAEWDAALPAFLLLGIGFLGARGYDLVFVIPVFVWLVSFPGDVRWLTWPALCLAASFLVPQRAVELVYEKILSNFLPQAVFDVVLSPYRSWALMLLLCLSLLIAFRIDRKIATP